jgi:hypothetical protein
MSGDLLLARGERAEALHLWQLAASYPQIDKSEHVEAQERLARHGGGGSTVETTRPPVSFDSLVNAVLARFGAESSAPSIAN